MRLENIMVTQDNIFWDRVTGDKVDVSMVSITADTAGYYFINPTESSQKVYTYRCSFEEVSILQVGSGVYEVKFWSVSSQYVRSDEPFLTTLMSKAQLIQWHAGDYWFAGEGWYVVRRAGKKFYKSVRNGEYAVRCIKCRCLADKETHTCDSNYYEVDDQMNTVNKR